MQLKNVFNKLGVFVLVTMNFLKFTFIDLLKFYSKWPRANIKTFLQFVDKIYIVDCKVH